MEAGKTGRDQWDSHSKSYNWVKAKEMVQVEEAAVAAESQSRSVKEIVFPTQIKSLISFFLN